jgi:hypothetical protein
MTRRPWTAQDQITAEVAAACGVPLASIARSLACLTTSVRYHLLPNDRKKSKVRSKAWAVKNQEQMRANKKRWASENQEQIKKCKAKYYQSNKQAFALYSKEYRERNLYLVKSRIKRWKVANHQRVVECNRQRKALCRAGRRSALVPIDQLKTDARFKIWRNCCAFCGVDAKHQRNRGYKKLTVEHALALINGGLDEASNILPACSTCNSSKNNLPIETWYRRQSFFTEARWRKICRHCPGAVIGQLPLAMPPTDAESA